VPDRKINVDRIAAKARQIKKTAQVKKPIATSEDVKKALQENSEHVRLSDHEIREILSFLGWNAYSIKRKTNQTDIYAHSTVSPKSANFIIRHDSATNKNKVEIIDPHLYTRQIPVSKKNKVEISG